MLKKKLVRDIWKNKIQFLTIFLMVFIGIGIYSGISFYMAGMSKSGNEYYKKNNLQDLWLYGSDFKKEDLEKVKKEKYVKNAEMKSTFLASMKAKDERTLQVNFISSNHISKFHVEEGKAFDYNNPGIWMDSFFAEKNKLRVGDVIEFSYGDKTIKEKIVGLIMTPDHVYDVKSEAEIFPNHKDYGYLYLSSKDHTDVIYNEIMVDVKTKKDISKAKERFEKLDTVIYTSTRENHMSHQMYKNEIEEGKTYVGIFSGLFLVIAILSVITTMTRIVKIERVQIGILKALGFKTRRISLLYIGYSFFISLLGAIAGLMMGPLLLGRYFLHIGMIYFEVPNYKIHIDPMSFVVSILVIILICLVTYLSCKSELKEKASEILRVKVPSFVKSKFEFRKGIFSNMSFSTKWNLRDIFRNKMRSMMAIVGIAGCTMLIVCAFGILNSMDSFVSWQFEKLYNFEYKMIVKSDISDDRYKEITDKYGPNSSMNQMIQLKGKSEYHSLFIDDTNNLVRYTNKSKDFIKLKHDGIFITRKEAKDLNLKLGDSVEFKFLGSDKLYKSKIIGIYRDPQKQGFTMSKKCFEKLDNVYQPDAIYTNRNMSEVDRLDGIEIIQSREEIKSSVLSMLENMRVMIVIMIIAAVVLGVIIIYNLGILSFVEKNYQFATLKVLGFSKKQIGSIFVKQNSWLTIAAIILGCPFGYLMTYLIFKVALGETYDFNAYITPLSYLIGILGTLLVSRFVNNFLTRKIKKIDMISSLKINE